MAGKGKVMARFAALFSLVLLTGFAGIALAEGGGWGGGEHVGKHQPGFNKIAERLGLTDAQKAEAKAIFQGNRETMKPMATNLRAERKNLRALLHADTIDEAAIRAETMRIAAIKADLNVNRAKISAQFRAILTPAQLAKLKDMKQKHQKRDDMIDTAPALY